MREALLRGAHALMAVLRVAAGAMLALSVAINFANIVGRYTLATSIPWAEETMLFLMIRVSASPLGAHMAFELLDSRDTPT